MDEKTLSMFWVFTGFSEHKCFVEVDHLVRIVRVHVRMCMRVKVGNQERKRKEEEKWGETGAEIERLQIKRELDQERVT